MFGSTIHEEDLFFEASRRTDAGERSAFLDRNCAGQPALRAHLEQLLALHAAAEHFFAEAECATSLAKEKNQKL